MPVSTTLSIRLSPEVKAKLGRLAQNTRRSASFLGAEAIATYVDQELAIIDGIQTGIADIAAGRVVPHDQAMRELDAAIEGTAAKPRK